ncbi:hypothetical protein BDA99DRAFT_533951 [Phascolomyces articulosus]|uniref:Uncharacterized protein n=1 Tax=Phascolomyces articulosus TaxID=60185 RepID=A0AAD5K7Y1_9FUNG|nr:hypothetical protein BDA99DRAFT_533951 [Phascolomyces articulosus]
MNLPQFKAIKMIPDPYSDNESMETPVQTTQETRQQPSIETLVEKEPVGVAPDFVPEDNINLGLGNGTLNEIERELGLWAFKNEVSNSSYASLVSLINKGLAKAHLSKEPYSLSTTSIEILKTRLEDDANTTMQLPFANTRVYLEDIEGIQTDWHQEITDVVGEIHFSYRNIKDVCQAIFSHPIFWKVMINKPSVHRQNGERVFLDIDSGEHWEEMQLKFPGNIILNILLGSDQTIVAGNGRHKAWPIYLKLGNVPMKFRNSEKHHASRVLAYLPVVNWKEGVNPPTWLATARVAIFHHCLSLILAPFRSENESVQPFLLQGPYNRIYPCIPILSCYIADLPEQRMIAIVKNGQTKFSCPRCLLPTAHFHLPYQPENVQNNGVILRSKEFMEAIYKHGKTMLNNGQSVTALCRAYSTHIVESPKDFISIYFRTLFGEYLYLMKFLIFWLWIVYINLEVYINILLNVLKRLLKHCRMEMRTSLITAFKELRSFKTGYILSALKNPIYTEMKSHMSILLSCVHDFIPLQASLCLRKFIDFFYLATRNIHTESSLKEMHYTLEEYNSLCPIFQSYSRSKLRFPKHHMLWKYHSDIRKFGVVSGYSTCQTEYQHKVDAKSPGRRMSSFVYYRDLLFDEYLYTMMSAPTSETISLPNIHPTIADRRLYSTLERGKPLLFSTIQDKYPNYPSIIPLIRCCLHTIAKGPNQTCSLGNMLHLAKYKAQVYRSLALNGAYVNGECYKKILYAHPDFYGGSRFDYALFEDGSVSKLLLFFTVKPKVTPEYPNLPNSIDLCLVERYTIIDQPHPSGFQVVTESENMQVYDRYQVCRVSDIIDTLHVVPDFSTALNDNENSRIFERYLVNNDTHPLIDRKGILKEVEDLVMWGHLEPSSSDEDENEEGLYSDDNYSDEGYSETEDYEN